MYPLAAGRTPRIHPGMNSPAASDGARGFAVAKFINNPPMNGWVCLKDVQGAFSIYKDEHSLKT